MTTKYITFQARFLEEDYEKLKKLAYLKDKRIAMVVREAIDIYLKDNKKLLTRGDTMVS